MLLVVEAGRWRRLHAKERMAAVDMWAAHLEIHQTLEFLESAKKWRIQPSKKKNRYQVDTSAWAKFSP
jgi:hypothetical protein